MTYNLEGFDKIIKSYNIIGWVYRKTDQEKLTQDNAIITKVEFGKCGYQDMWWGLKLYFSLEHGLSGYWSLPLGTQIDDFLNEMGVDSLKELVGRPIIIFSKGMETEGVGVNRNLVLKGRG